MSWNVSLRLNNIEQQIKNLENSGLLNPLEENIEGNGYDILNINDITCNTLNYTTLNPPISADVGTLEEVLTAGNDANNLTIDNLGGLTLTGALTSNGVVTLNGVTTVNNGFNATTIGCGSLVSDGDLTAVDMYCTTLNYTNLNPPISLDVGTLAQVLTAGNDAEFKNITNVGTLTMLGNIEMNNQAITEVGGITMTEDLDINFHQITNWANGTVDVSLNVANGNDLPNDTRAIFGVYNNSGNNGYTMGIGDEAGTLDEFNTFKIEDAISKQQYLRIDNSSIQQLTLSADKLLYKTDSTNDPSATSYILNSLGNPPMYKQIFSAVNDTIENKVIASSTPYWLWATKLYDGDTVFNYGVNYGELLLSYFSITITSPTPWVGTNNCQLYLGNSLGSVFDATKGNRIVFNCTNDTGGDANFTFTSTIPIVLYYQNGDVGTSFNTLYFLASFQDAGTYSFAFNNCNFMSTGTITGKISQPLAVNS